jgi:hypothetical protein
MPHDKYKKFLQDNPYPRELRRFDLIEDAHSSVYLYSNKRRLINFS